MKRKFKVGIVGGTGYVGQRFVTLLENHPWFEVRQITASPRSAGKTYEEAMSGRWKIDAPLPANVKDLVVRGTEEMRSVSAELDFVFCAVDMPRARLIELEESIARLELPVISNNSANRWTNDVPMIMPELNPEHAVLINRQRQRLGTQRGFIAVKPNCSIQSFVPALTPLRQFGLEQIAVTTYQAVSGAGKQLVEWPEMTHNVIPYIGGEEEKSEREPLRIWGRVNEAADQIRLPPEQPLISAQCYRVPVQEGHLAAVSVKFEQTPEREEILKIWRDYEPLPQQINLPSAPKPFLHYTEEDMRPQPVLDADFGRGMGVTIGRLREDPIFDYKFTCLSHNTIRGAAGGGILMAELLVHLGYLELK